MSPARWSTEPIPDSPGSQTLANALLLIHGDTLDDIEHLRVATENRVRSLIQVKGMVGTPEQERLDALVEGLVTMEKAAIKNLERVMQTHPLGPWAKEQIGVGDKQLGRLLAVIGDPADRARVSQLWSYCGFGVVEGEAPRYRRGQPLNWNPKAKMRTYLVAHSCLMQRHSPFRPVYDEGRAKYAEREIPDGHKHAMAMRLMSKEILKQLWVAAKELRA